MVSRLTRLMSSLALGTLVLTALTATTLYAQGSEPPRQPAIAFLDEQDLTADFDRLHAQKGQLRIDIRNNDPEQTQRVELRLVGMSPLTGKANPALDALLPAEPAVETLSPLETKSFTLAFSTASQPQAGSYQGILVATGARGDIIRRKFTLKVMGQGDEAPPQQPIRLAFSPDWLETLTLKGVNFLPSLLNPNRQRGYG